MDLIFRNPQEPIPTTCTHCGQDIPAPKEEIDSGFNAAPVVHTSFNERYAAIRKEIESARKDLRHGGWAKLYTALLELPKLCP